MVVSLVLDKPGEEDAGGLEGPMPGAESVKMLETGGEGAGVRTTARNGPQEDSISKIGSKFSAVVGHPDESSSSDDDNSGADTISAEGNVRERLMKTAQQAVIFRSSCVACQNTVDGPICGTCAIKIKLNLLDPASAGLKGEYYCLLCHKVVPRTHTDKHIQMLIPLISCNGNAYAWSQKGASWAAIFVGIQSDPGYCPLLPRPYLLLKPHGLRCEICCDLLSSECSDGSGLRFCTVKCWVNGVGVMTAEAETSKFMVEAEFLEDSFFCLICLKNFCPSDGPRHKDHDILHVSLEHGVNKPSVELEVTHPLARVWENIKKEVQGKGRNKKQIVTLRYEKALRCQSCYMRLVDGGGSYCCFECSLQVLENLSSEADERALVGDGNSPSSKCSFPEPTTQISLDVERAVDGVGKSLSSKCSVPKPISQVEGGVGPSSSKSSLPVPRMLLPRAVQLVALRTTKSPDAKKLGCRRQ